MNAGEHAADKSTNTILKKILSAAIFLAIVLGLAFVWDAFVFRAYGIPSGSMENTIMPGDKVYTEKLSYQFGSVEAGSIVTFDDPEIDGRTLVKRCVAVGGQTIDFHNGMVYVDGVPLSEPYTAGQPSEPLIRTAVEISYPYTIPDGHIWVMGDNRTNSQDSRYFGSVDETTVSGRAFAVVWPLDHMGIL